MKLFAINLVYGLPVITHIKWLAHYEPFSDNSHVIKSAIYDFMSQPEHIEKNTHLSLCEYPVDILGVDAGSV